MEITEKAQEEVIRDLRRVAKYTMKGIPEAHMEAVDVLSIERLTEKACKEIDSFMFESMKKEIAYRDLQDYRFYRAEVNLQFSDAYRGLGQMPMGRCECFYLVGYLDRYEIYYGSLFNSLE